MKDFLEDTTMDAIEDKLLVLREQLNGRVIGDEFSHVLDVLDMIVVRLKEVDARQSADYFSSKSDRTKLDAVISQVFGPP